MAAKGKCGSTEWRTAGPSARFPGFPVEVGGAANSMRLSLKKGAHAALSGVARQEIGSRFGRDDKGKGNG